MRDLVRPTVTVGVADEGIARETGIVIVAVVHGPRRLGPKDQLSTSPTPTLQSFSSTSRTSTPARGRAGGRGGKDAIENTIMDDGESGASVMQDVLERRPFQGRIDRHIDRAEIVDGEHHPQRQRRCRQHQDNVVALANAKFVQIAGEVCDLLRGLREGPAFTAFESRKDVVRSSAGVPFQRAAHRWVTKECCFIASGPTTFVYRRRSAS